LYSPAPIEPVADGKPYVAVRLRARFSHGAGQVAAFHAELDADIARVRLPVDKRRPLFHPDVGELAQGEILAVGCGNEQALDRILVAAVRLLHAQDQVELLFSLDHLGGRFARHGGIDQGIDVAHVQPVAGHLGPVRSNDQAGLAQLADDGDIGNARGFDEDVSDLRRFLFEPLRSGPNILTASALFSPVSASSTASSAGCV